LEQDSALGLMNSLLWTTMIVAGPVLAAALLVGLVISILQVATQLQEMTLSYVPKLFASALTLIFLGPWMLHKITQFAISAIATIPSLGRP
jgi:flagellar biosynthetic protein FliQ